MAGPQIPVLVVGDVVTPGPLNTAFANIKAFLSNIPYKRLSRYNAAFSHVSKCPEYGTYDPLYVNPELTFFAPWPICGIITAITPLYEVYRFGLHKVPAGDDIRITQLTAIASLYNTTNLAANKPTGTFTVKLKKAAAITGPWTDVGTLTFVTDGTAHNGAYIGNYSAADNTYLIESIVSTVVEAGKFLVWEARGEIALAADSFAVYNMSANYTAKRELQA